MAMAEQPLRLSTERQKNLNKLPNMRLLFGGIISKHIEESILTCLKRQLIRNRDCTLMYKEFSTIISQLPISNASY